MIDFHIACYNKKTVESRRTEVFYVLYTQDFQKLIQEKETRRAYERRKQEKHRQVKIYLQRGVEYDALKNEAQKYTNAKGQPMSVGQFLKSCAGAIRKNEPLYQDQKLLKDLFATVSKIAYYEKKNADNINQAVKKLHTLQDNQQTGQLAQDLEYLSQRHLESSRTVNELKKSFQQYFRLLPQIAKLLEKRQSYDYHL